MRTLSNSIRIKSSPEQSPTMIREQMRQIMNAAAQAPKAMERRKLKLTMAQENLIRRIHEQTNSERDHAIRSFATKGHGDK